MVNLPKATEAVKAKDDVETRKVTKEEAAFILGQGGKTKAKLCTVSGASIDLTENWGQDRSQGSVLQIRGTPQERKYARKYVDFVVAQRLGPVKIDNPAAHDDLTILTVPADTVSFITGKQGSFLRLVEDEWGALLFFLQVNPKAPHHYTDPSHTERLAIFGPQRRRRGAELKVMAAIEMKLPGYFTKNIGNGEMPDEGFATDTMIIKEEDYSYALGKSGSTRKKLARASSCIVEYVGRVAYFCGNKRERVRAREYLQWLLHQRVGEHVAVEHAGRGDVTMITVPNSCIGFVTGHRGSSLRAIEEETNTFCFIDGAADDGDDPKPLLIFGNTDDRRLAESLVWEKISTKYEEVEGWGDRGDKGRRKGKGRGDKGDRKGKGRGHDRGAYDSGYREADNERPVKKAGETITMAISDDDAAFVMGPGGKTKKKIAAVSGAYLELRSRGLEITGSPEERARAQKYIQLVMAQRIGPVKIDDSEQHDDLSIIEVPAEAISFVTGRQGSFLRLVEEEFGTLLFFLDFNKSSRRDQLERLAIFGMQRERRGAELKVMAAIEMKQPGFFTKHDSTLPLEDPSQGFSTDRMHIEEDDYSYALGKGGATRKKIARASGCVIEYIGRLAYLSGFKKERTRAREYLGWLFRQRVGPVEVNYANREDVTVLQVPKDCVGFVTGHKGTSLRAVEEATGTFCFIEGGREDPHRDPKPLLVFGSAEARRLAEEKLRLRIDQKLVEGWVHEDGGERGEGGKGGKGRDGKGRQKGKDGKGGGKDGLASPERPEVGGASDAASPTLSAPDATSAAALEERDDEEDNEAWGDWGGESEDEGQGDKPAAAASAAGAGAASPGTGTSAGASAAEARLVGAAGRWSGGSGGAYSGVTPTSGGQAMAAASPQRGAGAAASVGYSPQRVNEDMEIPFHLIHEEAFPSLGDMGAKPKKGARK